MKFWNKKWNLALSLFLTLAIMSSGIVACSDDENNDFINPDAILTVIDGNKTNDYTLEELKALGVTTGEGGMLTTVGEIIGPMNITGSVSLTDVLDDIGGLEADEAVRITAKDDYAMTLSYQQVINADFPTFDAVSAAEMPSSNNTVSLLYEVDGTELDNLQGPLRLGILSEAGTVTEGHWWVKWVVKIEIIPEIVPWVLTLDGAIQVEMDLSTFESGATPDCHGVTWADGEGNEWTGIPLWRLIGWVDDDNKHKVEPGVGGDVPEGGFNDALAAAGYQIVILASDGYSRTFESADVARNDNQIVILASDGYSRTFESADVARNDNWIIAYLCNGEPLSEDHWPLKLVGDDLASGQMVSLIITIQLVFE